MLKFFLLSLMSLQLIGCNKSDDSSSTPESSEAVTTVDPQTPAPTTPIPVTPVPSTPTPTNPPSCAKAGSTQVNPGNRFTGLKPITPDELKSAEKSNRLRRIKSVWPNELGLKRMKLEKTLKAAPVGEETAIEEEATEGFGGALPTTVDNSTLSAFPSIGQQAWNSCVGWAMGYYQWSHNTGLAMGWNNKSNTNTRCSPKFVYSMINSGVDQGAYFSDAFNLMQKHGCITWDQLPEDRDYRGWSSNADHWQSALSYRTNAAQYVYNVDTATGLEQVKQLLTNGYVLTFGTYIDSWQFTTVKSSGQKALRFVNGTQGSHAMTIVGYDDNAWIDINENNVSDAGEVGALKIANSWGTSWGNSGYVWIAYDALKSVSAVSGGPSSGRQPAIQSKLVYHLPVRAVNGVAYKPKKIAKFTLSHNARNQLSVKFSSGSATFTPFALINKGGAYPFSGSVAMDLTDISTSNSVYAMTVTDNTSGNPASISTFEVIDLVNSTQAASTALATPASVDGSSKTVSADLEPVIPNSAPIARFTTASSSVEVPAVVTFDASSSYDLDGTISQYSWSFGDGSFATGISASKTYTVPGQYTVTLTVKDNDGTTTSTSKVMQVTSSDSCAQ